MYGCRRNFDNKIEYVEVKMPPLISYKHIGESEDYNFTVSISFEALEGKTIPRMKSKVIIEELN